MGGWVGGLLDGRGGRGGWNELLLYAGDWVGGWVGGWVDGWWEEAYLNLRLARLADLFQVSPTFP